MKKKLISALLTLCMVLSLLPVSALADVTPTIEVTPGKMEDHPKDSTTDPIATLCKANSYKVDVDTKASDKIPVTVEAKQIVEHSNGQHQKGYWIGATFTPSDSGNYVILYKFESSSNWSVDTDSCTDGSIVSLYIDAFKDGNLNTEGGDITVGVFSKGAVTINDTTTGAVTINETGEPLTTKTYTVKASEGCTKEGDVESVTIGAINVEADQSLPGVTVTSDPANSVTATISWAEKDASGNDEPPETAVAGKTYTATITVTPNTNSGGSGYTLTEKTVYKIGLETVPGTLNSNVATLKKEFEVPLAKFTVTFNYNYDNAPASNPVTITDGDKVTKPAAPTRNGYTFGGWYKEAACTNQFNFDTETITADTTLYAKWTENVTPTPTKYTVSFNAGDGTGTMAAVEVEKAATGDTTYTLPECTFTAPTGKTFAGWKVGDADVVQPAGAVVTLTANTTMTATWADEVKADAPVEVTNNTATATVTAPTTVNSGDVVTIDVSKDSQSTEITSDGITASEGVTAAEVTLPKTTVDKLSAASSVEVTTPIGSITLPQTALTAISSDSSVTASTPATLTIAPTDKASEVTSTDTTTEVSATFEVKVTTGTGTNEKEIGLTATALRNQFIKLALNIGKGLNNPKICYLSDDGKTLGDALAVSVPYDTTTGTVTVLAPHLTNFAILTDKATTGDVTMTYVKNNNFTFGYYDIKGLTPNANYVVQLTRGSNPQQINAITSATADANGDLELPAQNDVTVTLWKLADGVDFVTAPISALGAAIFPTKQ